MASEPGEVLASITDLIGGDSCTQLIGDSRADQRLPQLDSVLEQLRINEVARLKGINQPHWPFILIAEIAAAHGNRVIQDTWENNYPFSKFLTFRKGGGALIHPDQDALYFFTNLAPYFTLRPYNAYDSYLPGYHTALYPGSNVTEFVYPPIAIGFLNQAACFKNMHHLVRLPDSVFCDSKAKIDEKGGLVGIQGERLVKAEELQKPMKTKIRQTVKAELIGMAMAATIFNDQTTLDRINTLQGDTNLFNQTEFDALTKGLLVQLKELVSKKN